MAPCAEIDLIGVQVTDKKTGDVGTIFFQNINTVNHFLLQCSFEYKRTLHRLYILNYPL
jgi:hypothetical protein